MGIKRKIARFGIGIFLRRIRKAAFARLRKYLLRKAVKKVIGAAKRRLALKKGARKNIRKSP